MTFQNPIELHCNDIIVTFKGTNMMKKRTYQMFLKVKSLYENTTYYCHGEIHRIYFLYIYIYIPALYGSICATAI